MFQGGCMWALVFSGLILLLVVVDVESWGKLGHEMVGNLAWRLLSGYVRSEIETILAHAQPQDNSSDCIGCSPLGLVADWADQVRYRYKWSSPLHFIDVMDDAIPGGCPVQDPNSSTNSASCQFDYDRDCPFDFCVAGAIVNYTELVANSSCNNDTKSAVQPLEFLVHFVGDIHQPLHVSRKTDKGGNDIHVHYSAPTRATDNFFLRNRFQRLDRAPVHSRAANLHSVWDTELIETFIQLNFGGSRAAMEEDLWSYICQMREEDRFIWNDWMHCPDGSQKDCTIAWAQESLQDALVWAYRDVNGTDSVVNDTVLSQEYYETRIPIVQERLAAAGVRLAVTLTSALHGGNMPMFSGLLLATGDETSD